MYKPKVTRVPLRSLSLYRNAYESPLFPSHVGLSPSLLMHRAVLEQPVPTLSIKQVSRVL